MKATARAMVSLCMMVKNEERNLADCLGAVRDVVDEVVVVDTGSTDRTRQLAQSLGARVIEASWQDSFSAARNTSIEHARGDWIFWMDADDRIDPGNMAKLRNLFAGLNGDNRAYVMKCLCVAAEPGETATVVDHVRLFRNDPRLRWSYRVHEQILPAVRAMNGEVSWSEVVIEHVGYTDEILRRKKLDRDLRLLRIEVQEQPDDPFTLFNLGSVLRELGQQAEAIPLLQRSLGNSHPQDSIVRKLYSMIATCQQQLGLLDDAPGDLLPREIALPEGCGIVIRREHPLEGKEGSPRRGGTSGGIDPRARGGTFRQRRDGLAYLSGAAQPGRPLSGGRPIFRG